MSSSVQRFGVIGSGSFGRALARGLKTHGYDVRIATRTAGKLGAFSKETGIPEGRFDEVAAWGIETLEQAMDGVRAQKAVHICYGYGTVAVLAWKQQNTRPMSSWPDMSRPRE